MKIFNHFAMAVVAVATILGLSSFTTSTNVTDHATPEVVELIVKEMKTELPMDIGGGMFITAVYTANSNLVVECTCADSVVDLIRLGFSEMSKEEKIRDFFTDQETKILGRICAEANYGIRFVYLTKSRTNQTELYFTSSDLKTLLPSAN